MIFYWSLLLTSFVELEEEIISLGETWTLGTWFLISDEVWLIYLLLYLKSTFWRLQACVIKKMQFLNFLFTSCFFFLYQVKFLRM